MALIHKIHKCQFESISSNFNVTYNLSKDFFTDGAAGPNVYNVTLGIPGNGEVENVGFVYSSLMGGDFHWNFYVLGSDSGGGITHFLFNRKGSKQQFGNAVIDFVVPNIGASKVLEKLDTPCTN